MDTFALSVSTETPHVRSNLAPLLRQHARPWPARATAVLSDRASLLYFATLEVIDAITSDAFWKAASRSVMP